MISINEIRIDQTGTDTDEYFELVGTTGDSLNDLTYLVIGDGAAASGSGVIEAVISLTGQTLDSNGFFVAAENNFSLGTANLITNLNFENGDNVTHLLVSGFIGVSGTDLDTNDDGILEITPWTTLIDAVALVENFGAGEQVYSANTVGSNNGQVPVHIFRNPDETGTFAIGELNSTANDTPGASNNAIASLSLTTTTTSFTEAETATITVTRTGDTTNTLTVNLSSSDSSEVTVPTTVEIAAGQTSATFIATGIDDNSTDGDQQLSILATATNLASATTVALTVTDIGVPGGGSNSVVINEVHADPDGAIAGDANGDGIRDGNDDEFVEIVNISGADLDLSGATLADSLFTRHIFASGTVLADQQAIVVFGGGTPTGTFGGAIVQTASTGNLSLNNTGDTLTLRDSSGTELALFSYGGEGGNNQSLTLAPDLTGTVSQHAIATGSGGTLFSPGTQVDGTGFAGNVRVAAIYEIQGAGHISPFVGQTVSTSGIVTAVDSNGFYLQDATGDNNIATSDALFVFTSSTPTVTVGEAIAIEGTVSEFTPGGTSTGNLSTTQLINPTNITISSSGNTLPTAVILGANGRPIPTENIDDDNFASFDPTTDGLDFFESLEGMLVTAANAQAIAGTNPFEEIFAVTDNGANATGLSSRGTLTISPNDFNPEKIQIDVDAGVFDFAVPNVNTGDRLGDVTGVLSYNFGNFELIPTVDFTGNIIANNLTPETTTLTGTTDQLTLASYNLLNLDTNDNDGDTDVAAGRFEAIASQIINNLRTPDIIGLQEIQDNSGSIDDGTIAADAVLQALVAAIANAGGPTYQFIDNTFIANNASGGQPGGNIRTAFLYNPNRVSLVPNSVQTIASQASGQPFTNARLPLVATFNFNGEAITVVNNHFSSKGGSAPIFGNEQDFAARQEDVNVNGSLDERQAQAAAVKGFVEPLITNGINVAVLGDFNEFEFVSPLTTLETAGLTNLTKTLPDHERYTFTFQGNAQALDHILVNNNLASTAEFDIVHVNAEFTTTDARASDHDPILTRLTFPTPPSPPSDSNNANNVGFDPQLPGTQGILKLFGNANLETRIKISVQANSVSTNSPNEIVMFQVDDDAGTVNGVGKDEANYLTTILQGDRLLSSFSLLANQNNPNGLPAGLNIEEFSTLLPNLNSNNNADIQFGFLLVENGTIDELRAGINRNVFFSNTNSNTNGFQINNFSSSHFEVAFEGNNNTLQLNIEAVSSTNNTFTDAVPGTDLQAELEVLDLRTTGNLTGQISVFSEASFDNTIGFYQTNTNGDILSATGATLATVGDVNYIQIMLEQARTLNIEIDRHTTTSFLFAGGGILAPFIIANGDFNRFNISEIYTPFIGANADGVDHVQMFGDNVFGFEDLAGGGDRDFDDIIVQITFP